MKKEIKFKVLVKVPYMYDFLMKNAYQGIKGIAGIIISLGALILYLKGFGGDDSFLNALLIIVAAMMVLNPFYLYYKAYKQVKLNKSFQEPLDYTINKEGITVGQGDEEGLIPWEAVATVIETRKSLLVYTSKRSAFIFPKDELAEEYDAFKQIIRENIEEKRRSKMK